MTEKSILDLVVDELRVRQGLLRGELSKRFKRTKPFRTEPISEDEMLLRYETMTTEDMEQLISTDGEEAVGEMIQQMEILKRRKI